MLLLLLCRRSRHIAWRHCHRIGIAAGGGDAAAAAVAIARVAVTAAAAAVAAAGGELQGAIVGSGHVLEVYKRES